MKILEEDIDGWRMDQSVRDETRRKRELRSDKVATRQSPLQNKQTEDGLEFKLGGDDVTHDFLAVYLSFLNLGLL